MITRSIQAKLLVFAVFFVGIAMGALVDNIYRTRVVQGVAAPPANNPDDHMNPQEREKKRDEAMAKYLGLDQSQQDQIHKILEETRTEYRQLQDKVDPQFKAIEDGSRAKIRAVFNDEQRRKADEFRESHKGNRGRPSRPDNPGRDQK